jgi:hypothetical protein
MGNGGWDTQDPQPWEYRPAKWTGRWWFKALVLLVVFGPLFVPLFWN